MDTALGETLHKFGGDLYVSGTPLQTGFTENTRTAQAVNCALTVEDPMPRADAYPAAGPLSRSVAITLRATGTSPRFSVPRPSLTPNTIGLAPTGDTRALPGAGVDSVISSGLETLRGAREVRARLRVENIDIDISAAGMDWSGGAALPVSDSPNLNTDLTNGAEDIAAALIDKLPNMLSRSAIDWTLQPGAPENDPPFTTTRVPVWNPCDIADSALAEAGLNPATAKDHGDNGDDHSCDWQGDGFYVSARSSALRFRESIFQLGLYTSFRPVTVAGRPALDIDSASFGDSGCELAFDAPQGQRNGNTVGIIELQAWSSGPAGQRMTGRDALCGQLIRVAQGLVPYLPAGRA
ncbi:DUF3558 family protein [Nocardia sp. NPDC056000]|uniref:DUF3558 family protein n=1 Tax=Nocardia sp. NPDC056000 TaxID=3345674 RepID=UPI0035DE859F